MLLTMFLFQKWLVALFLKMSERGASWFNSIKVNSIKITKHYLYSAFYDTIAAKQLYRKCSFCNRFIFCRNLVNIFNLRQNLVNSVYCLRVWIISSQVFGHLRSFKGWIQTEACVIPSYHGMIIRNRETDSDIISVAVVPSKNKVSSSTQAKA